MTSKLEETRGPVRREARRWALLLRLPCVVVFWSGCDGVSGVAWRLRLLKNARMRGPSRAWVKVGSANHESSEKSPRSPCCCVFVGLAAVRCECAEARFFLFFVFFF